MKALHLAYKPIQIDEKGTINEAIFLQYIEQSPWCSLLERLVISPLNNSIIKSGKEKFDFGDFKVSVSRKEKSSTSWSKVYEKVKTFLEIRSEDSKAGEYPNLKYEKGLGYCISIEDVLREITDRKNEFTSRNNEPILIWPKIKNTEPPLRGLIIPDINYSKIMKETALISMRARRFKKSLTSEVIDAYKEANEIWIKRETGYDRDNMPPEDISLISRVRHIGNLRYILINLVREDKHDYKAIIETIFSDLAAIKEGKREQLWKIYRPAENFVNLKRLVERLNAIYNSPDNVKPDIRYEIVP